MTIRLTALFLLALGGATLVAAQEGGTRVEASKPKVVRPSAVPSSVTKTTTPAAKQLPVWQTFAAMHAYEVVQFNAAPGKGISRMPRMNDSYWAFDHQLVVNGTRYYPGTMELVGLLQQDPPVAYRTDGTHEVRGLPVGKLPSKAAHPEARALTAFETASLAQLHRGKDVVAAPADKTGAVLLVGAIRAQQSCLECHDDKKVGDLLGAFTYKLGTTDPFAGILR